MLEFGSCNSATDELNRKFFFNFYVIIKKIEMKELYLDNWWSSFYNHLLLGECYLNSKTK